MEIFLSVGEPSGDLHGANLMGEMQRRSPELTFSGLGGPRMAQAGCRLLSDMSELAVMGVFPVLAKLPEFFSLIGEVDRYLGNHRPDAAVLVDYPGFNTLVAWRAKCHGIPVFYYGMPQWWAWLPWRLSLLAPNVDHALCKLPFEVKWFGDRGMKTTYVGHPYFDELAAQRLDEEFLASQQGREGRLVTILPGSRSHEVESNLPFFLKSAERIRQACPDVRFAIASYNEKQGLRARQMAAETNLPIDIFVGRTAELIHLGESCLACSGSVSLELLYHLKPAAILYYVSWLAAMVARRVVTVRYMTLVNLLAADELAAGSGEYYDPNEPGHEQVIYPEYPTWEDKSPQLAEHIIEWMTDEPKRQAVIARLTELRAKLAHRGASAVAAEYILGQLSGGVSAEKVLRAA